MLENSGLLIYEHLSPDTINELYFDNRKDYLTAFETIHYVHAVKNKLSSEASNEILSIVQRGWQDIT